MSALDDIFSNTAPAEDGEGEDDFWNKASVPLRETSSFDLGAFEGDEIPEQKNRSEVAMEGIDRTPMFKVSEIRERFNKGGTAPLFPKQQRYTTSTGRSPGSPAHRGGGAQGEQSGERLEGVGEDDSMPTMVPRSPQEYEEQRPPIVGESNLQGIESQKLSDKEFFAIAKLHKCDEALTLFTTPVPVDIVIKPEDPQAGAPVLLKEMLIRFSNQQRLLVLVRKSATRYIRLSDVVKVDVTSDCLAYLKPDSSLPSQIAKKKALALYFVTTKHPMTILVENEHLRDSLLQLIIFLRQLFKSNNPFEVVA